MEEGVDHGRARQDWPGAARPEPLRAAYAELSTLESIAPPPRFVERPEHVKARAAQNMERPAEAVLVNGCRGVGPDEHVDVEPVARRHRDREVPETGTRVGLPGKLVCLHHPAKHINRRDGRGRREPLEHRLSELGEGALVTRLLHPCRVQFGRELLEELHGTHRPLTGDLGFGTIQSRERVFPC